MFSMVSNGSMLCISSVTLTPCSIKSISTFCDDMNQLPPSISVSNCFLQVLKAQHLKEAVRDRNGWRELIHVVTKGDDIKCTDLLKLYEVHRLAIEGA